jgi:hypothetical protein
MLTEWIITLSPEERERAAFHESGLRDTAPPRSPAARREKHRGTQEWRCQAADAAAG